MEGRQAGCFLHQISATSSSTLSKMKTCGLPMQSCPDPWHRLSLKGSVSPEACSILSQNFICNSHKMKPTLGKRTFFLFLFSLVVTIPTITSRSSTLHCGSKHSVPRVVSHRHSSPSPPRESALLSSTSRVIWTLHIQGSRSWSQSVVFPNSGFYHMQNTFRVINGDMYTGTLFHLIATEYVIGIPCFVYPSHPGTPERLPLWGHHD